LNRNPFIEAVPVKSQITTINDRNVQAMKKAPFFNPALEIHLLNGKGSHIHVKLRDKQADFRLIF
jgi:hypothetical protein